MESTAMDFLSWVRGPGFVLALAVFLLGMTVRIFEVFSLGRPADLSAARPKNGSGWRTLWHRSIPDRETFRRDAATYVAGYIFHLGFFITLLFFAPHIELIRNVTGLSWPNLPTAFVDATAVVTLITLLLVLAMRLTLPVRRFLSSMDDYVAWTVTFLPLLTGYLTYHHLSLPYQTMLAVHILSVELLLVVFPFTKLTHAFAVFLSRWYNGEVFARKGVQS